MKGIALLAECPDWAVCVKPAGMDSEKEVPEALGEAAGGSFLPVHRLDRAAAGLMVYARTPAAAAQLSRLIQAGQLTKEYMLLCHGALPAKNGPMEDLLWKDIHKNKVYVVSRPRAGVREARLTYRVLGSPAPDRTLVRVRLETGRTHQIRVQFASRGCPLWGDRRYGARDREKELYLFSCALSFPWQGGEKRFELLPDWAGEPEGT